MWTNFSNQTLSLAPNEVHIWSVNIKNHIDRLSSYWELLKDDEKAKALQFRFQKDKNCYVIARGTLRKMLGKYMKKCPDKIEFQIGEFGKPYVKNAIGIEFNLSHSTNIILIGFVKKHKLGVDVEDTNRPIEVEKIAKHFFSREEVDALLDLNKTYYNQAFYNCWTRKEAFIKALGSGLSFPLDQFVVSLDSSKEAKLIETKWNHQEKERWVLHSLEPEKNYIGAFAVKGNVSTIQTWKYQ